MIEAMFLFGPDVILIRIEGHHITYGNTSYGAQMATIHGLQLSKPGVEKQFPDLIGNPFWREEAISRVLEHIKSMPGEKAILQYLRKEFEPHGYVMTRYQQNGYRSVKV